MEVQDGGSAYANAKAGRIETSSGKLFDPNAEAPLFDIEDIAHSLAQIVRWNGQCRFFYSVAEHSIMVSYLMELLDLGDPLEGLLHDGTEAYLSDVPSPIKQFLPDWQKLDAQLEVKLRKHFNVGDKTRGCKEADWIALYIECLALIPSQGIGEQWVDPNGYRDRAVKLCRQFKVIGLAPEYAKRKFLSRYRELTRGQL